MNKEFSQEAWEEQEFFDEEPMENEEEASPKGKRRSGAKYRRRMEEKKLQNKITLANRDLLPGSVVDERTGRYLKRPKNSNGKKLCKKKSNRCARQAEELPAKGNQYKKMWDRWSVW